MSDCCTPPAATAVTPILEARGVEVRANGKPLVRNVSFGVQSGQVFGLIGPSGAGKSTLLRALNRLTDLIPGLSVRGDVRLRGQSIYAPGTDVNALREKVGMLFQQPVIFPTSSRVGVSRADRWDAVVRPSFSTVTRSPISRISASRCEM